VDNSPRKVWFGNKAWRHGPLLEPCRNWRKFSRQPLHHRHLRHKEKNRMYDEQSFYAVNKLIDFAKGNTIQKQMIQSMNGTIATMRIPGVDNPVQGTPKKPEEENSDED
jgi:hypothetical protein